MLGNNQRGVLKPFRAYLPRSLKFYGLKNEKLSAGIFILMLTAAYLANYISLSFSYEINFSDLPLKPDELINIIKSLLLMNALNLGTFIFTNLFASLYLFAYIRDLKNISYTTRECLTFFVRKAFPVIILSIINILAIFTGLFLLIVPGIVIYLMFIFSNCFMMDKSAGIIASLKSSLDLTHGYKSQIFSIIIIFNLITFIITAFFQYSGGVLINSFISAFISTIINLMFQRLLALMYVDIRYNNRTDVKNEI